MIELGILGGDRGIREQRLGRDEARRHVLEQEGRAKSARFEEIAESRAHRDRVERTERVMMSTLARDDGVES